MHQICVLWQKHYGKILPAEDTFMFHFVDDMTGTSIISCHSCDSNFFKSITEAIPLIKNARNKHEVTNEGIVSNNYWEKVSTEAKNYNMLPIEYISLKHTTLPERNDEYQQILTSSVKDNTFTSLLKRAMIKDANKRISTIQRVKSFFNSILRNNKDEKEEVQNQDENMR